MAKGTSNGTTEATADAPFGLKADGTPRKRAGSTGPRKSKPLHLAIEVKDRDGNVIPDATVTVHRASKDFETIYGHMEQNGGLTRMRVPLDNVAD